uniref:NPH3 domain-containing protein n=1 Tax=Oryza punctata TaxID=4537 RepID=A0A0E0LQX7_ORYPU
MACLKLGSRADVFRKQGQDWYCTTGLPSDITVTVGEQSFHLHKFPLLSKSGLLERCIREKIENGDDSCVIDLSDIPGGAKAFELTAKFCYGVKFEMTASNVVHLRCAAEYLEMTEEIAEGNLIAQTENFLTQTVLRSWKDSIKALHTCDDILDLAEKLQIVKRCIDSIATKSCTDPDLFGWPVVQYGGPMQSPGGSVLWNGISTGARPRHSSPDWWYDDVSCLSLPLYKKVISAMEYRGINQDIIVGSLNHYAKRRLPGLNRRKSISDVSSCLSMSSLTSIPSEEEQKYLLEEIDRLLPFQRGVTSCKLLFGLLRTAIILKASSSCVSNLERRIAEVAPDVNLKLPKFRPLAAAIPDYARPIDDGLYRAIDIYLKFPLLSKSGLLERCIREKIENGDDSCVIDLSDIPGGAKAFELTAKFCYGVKFEMTASNVVHLRCAAEYLEMTEEIAEGNLIAQTENFLTQTVLRSWKDSIKALHTCDDILDLAEKLQIVKRCIDSIATKSCTDPDLFGWPVVQYGGPMQSPGGSVLWNGISTGARPRHSSPDWWYDDVSCLSLPLYKKVISAMEYRGINQDIIVGSLNHYAKRRLPGLNRRKSISDVSSCLSMSSLTSIPSEEEQKYLLEEIDRLLPFQRGVTSCKLLFGLLRTAIILKASSSCVSNLERRIAEVAPDVNLKLPKFRPLAAAIPDYARPIDDGLYRAIDIYLKAHPYLSESEKEELCRVMDCQKLSLEACTHAAQNERLPLRVIVQVLFFEQLQLRSSIAECLMVSENLEGGSRQLIPTISGEQYRPGWPLASRENQALREGMDNMKQRVADLEKECSTMRDEIERLGRSRSTGKGRFSLNMKPQICSTKEAIPTTAATVSEEKMAVVKGDTTPRLKLSRHKKKLSIEA